MNDCYFIIYFHIKIRPILLFKEHLCMVRCYISWLDHFLIKINFLCFTDIADASVTQEPPCFADDVCRSKYNGALHQDLAGCDPVSRACLCPRGFQMQEGVCLGESYHAAPPPLQKKKKILEFSILYQKNKGG